MLQNVANIASLKKKLGRVCSYQQSGIARTPKVSNAMPFRYPDCSFQTSPGLVIKLIFGVTFWHSIEVKWWFRRGEVERVKGISGIDFLCLSRA